MGSKYGVSETTDYQEIPSYQLKSSPKVKAVILPLAFSPSYSHKQAFRRLEGVVAVLWGDYSLGVGGEPEPQILSLFQKWNRKFRLRDATCFQEEESHTLTQSLTSFSWSGDGFVPTFSHLRPALPWPHSLNGCTLSTKLLALVHTGGVKGRCSLLDAPGGSFLEEECSMRERIQLQKAANLKYCLNSALSWATLEVMPLITLNPSCSFFF